MAERGKSICRHPGCGKLIDAPGRCEQHAKQLQKQADADRGSAHERGYTSAWTKARAHYLRSHPLCVYCQRRGWITAATVVDHIKAHRFKEAMDSGDPVAIARAKELFWDSANWQALCKPHHDIDKQREEAADRKSQAVGG